MSLRYRINISIFFSSLCILVLGSSIAIWQARDAVKKEIDSSINMAVQLVTFGFSQTPFNESEWLPKFNSMHQTRHLSIQLKEPSGRVINFVDKIHAINSNEKPPQWFVALVSIDYPQVEHQITSFNGEQFTLIIRANPLDEITEVWQESINFLSLLFLLTLFTFLAVNLAFNKALRSIDVIVDALKVIETGHYRQKLPDFSIQEYDSIAKAINHMTDKLNATQRENRALARHTLAIQEDERQRLSQELHDELGQSLTAIKVMAVTVGRAQTGGAGSSVDIKQTTDSIVSICDHLIAVVRSMMHQLHPLVLTELGLKATMEDLLNHWSSRNPELNLTIICPDEVDQLEQKITIQIFRVVQECLTNIVRHSQAKQASVSLAIDRQGNAGPALQLKVIDDGQGCVMDKIKAGFGLLGMRERINSLGGELVIQTQPRQGMSIVATIPLS
jgi:two-component system sensor histidine kinase UhpB